MSVCSDSCHGQQCVAIYISIHWFQNIVSHIPQHTSGYLCAFVCVFVSVMRFIYFLISGFL